MVKKLKRRTFEILELAQRGDAASRVFDLFIMALISLNVIAVILGTVEPLGTRYSRVFSTFELASVVVFTVEYLLRLWTCVLNERFRSPLTGRVRYALSPLALIDLFAILPFYLPMLIPIDLRFLRALRLFRLLRLLKLGRYSDSLRTLAAVLRAKKEELAITAFVVLILLIIASSLMYFAEMEAQPEVFSSIPAAMWWGVATLTTVGYGDICPVTAVGKFFGAFIAILGIGMVALPAGILASGFAEEIQRRRAKRRICPHCGKQIERDTG